MWPRLLEASLQAKPGDRVKHFLAVYRRLPLIVQHCGAQIAYNMLTKVHNLNYFLNRLC